MRWRAAPWVVVALWLAAVAVALPFALRQSDRLTAGGFDVGGAQSQRVEQRLEGIPADFGATVLVGVLVDHGGARQGDYARALADLDAAARAVPGVDLARTAREAALFFARARPGRPVVVPLTVGVDEFRAPDTAKALRERLRLGDGGGRYGAVTLHLAGQGALWAAMFDVTKDDLRDAELLGFPVVLAVLLVAFGSVASALLPLALGAVTVGITGALVYAISGELLMNFYATNMASMIGLGVAVDYSLFIVVRYREELRRGATPDAARRTAMRTSGVAVMVSGCAVVLALAGLFLVDTAAVRSLALAAIIVVLVAMLAAATLLPALLRIVGARLAGRASHADSRGPGGVARWADAVLRRPAAALLLGAAILAALCLPALGMRIGDGALRQLPAGHETRVGFDAAARVTEPGRGAPVKVLVARRHVDRAVALLRADPEVVRTGVRTQTRDTTQILIVATPRHDGDSEQVRALVKRLRERLPPGSLVGGNTAAQVDFDDAITSALPRVTMWIVALTFVLLLAALRSLPIALGGVLTNLLSVAASFGVLTIVFVWIGGGYVETIALPLILAVVFGLSMDYQVFLLSRIRERYRAHGDTHAAVRDGLVSSARTITSAAVIMVAVFLAFVVTGVPAVQQVGLGTAAAIAIDATLVRLLVVPAAMALAGPRCWWLPHPRRALRRRATTAG